MKPLRDLLPPPQDEEASSEINDSQVEATLETKHSYDETRSLKTRQYSQAPVLRLPPELISQIFMLVVMDYWDEEDKENEYIRPPWVGLTHVCQAWRAISLNTPQLWSKLKNFSSKWADVQLERSRGVELCLRIPEDLSEKEKQRVLNVLALAHRLRSLSNTVQLPVVFSEGRPDFLDLIGSTPQLRQVNLKGWIIPWTSPLFSGLTSLKLYAGFSTDTFGNLSSFLDALERMPSLVELKLDWITGNIRGLNGVPKGSRIIRLDGLRKLSLQIPIPECTAIVTHLSYPLTTCVNIQTVPLNHENMWYEHEELGNTLIPHLTSSLYSAWNSDRPSGEPSFAPKASTVNVPMPLSIRCMSILMRGGGQKISSAGIDAWFEELDFTRLIEDPSHTDHLHDIPDFNLCIGLRAWRESGLDLGALGHHIIASLSLNKLGAVALDGELCVESFNILAKLPSLRSIHLQERALGSFLLHNTHCRTLMETSHEQIGKGAIFDDDNPPFPKLTRIGIDGVDFGVSNLSEPPQGTVKAELDELLDFLRFRRDVLRLPIQWLRVFDAANLSAADLTNISSLVTKIVKDRDRTPIQF